VETLIQKNFACNAATVLYGTAHRRGNLRALLHPPHRDERRIVVAAPQPNGPVVIKYI